MAGTTGGDVGTAATEFGTAPEPVDDIHDDVSFGPEDCNEQLALLVDEYAQDRERGAAILRLRLGISGAAPETLTLIGARYDLARDRVRQLHTKAVGELIRHATRTGVLPIPEYSRRYPTTARDTQLMRALLAETYATDTDIAAGDLCYLKLRLAGHNGTDAKRIAGYVTQRITAWRRKTNHRMTRLQNAPSEQDNNDGMFADVQWPIRSGSPAPLPTDPTRALDLDDDARGWFYLDTLGRDVGFDSGLQAKLLCALNRNAQVRTFQEFPEAIGYRLDDDEHIHFPCVAVELVDKRIVLIDVHPLGHVALRINRAKAVAAREYAHSNGWGWLVWTGSRVGVPELQHRRVDPAIETRLREQLDTGPVRWSALRQVRTETGLELLDFAALAVQHEWRWERGPFRLSESPLPPR